MKHCIAASFDAADVSVAGGVGGGLTSGSTSNETIEPHDGTGASDATDFGSSEGTAISRRFPDAIGVGDPPFDGEVAVGEAAKGEAAGAAELDPPGAVADADPGAADGAVDGFEPQPATASISSVTTRGTRVTR